MKKNYPAFMIDREGKVIGEYKEQPIRKSTKVLLAILAILVLLMAWLWAGGLLENKSLNDKLKEKELQLREAETAAIVSREQAEKHKKIAHGLGLERDELISDFEEFKKNRPKRQEFPEVCKSIADNQKNPPISGAMGSKSSEKSFINTMTYLCKQIVLERQYSDFVNLENEKLNRIIVLGDEVILELDLTVENLEESNKEYQAALLASKGITDIWEKKARKGWLKGFLAGSSVIVGGVVLYSIGKAIANIFR